MRFEQEKEVIINNLSEYIEVIEKIDSNNYYFRGENQKYIGITASTFRNLNGTVWESKFYDYKTMINEYYKKVANMLTDLERENFMPYAQHHGLPTPLIDVSDNPLTALYFATGQTQREEQDGEGYVYLFSKNRSIDIGNLMIADWNRDILQDFINEDQEVWELLLSEIGKIKLEEPDYFNSMFIDLIYWCSNYAISRRSLINEEPRTLEEKVILWFKHRDLQILDKELENIKVRIKNDEFKIKELDQIYFYLSKIYQDKEHEQLIEKYEKKKIPFDFSHSGPNEDTTDTLGYLILLKSYLYVLNYHVGAWEVHHLPIFPNLTVYPTILFDRLLVQDGFFLYQLSMYKFEKTYNTQTYLIQEIVPDITFKIKGKESIIKELDAIGINQSKLFPDPDNIAAYMKRKPRYQFKNNN